MAKMKKITEKDYSKAVVAIDFKAMREAKGKSLAEAAEEMGLTEDKLKAVEEFDKHQKTGEVPKALCAYYEIPTDLFKGYMAWRAEEMNKWWATYNEKLEAIKKVQAEAVELLDIEMGEALPKGDTFVAEGKDFLEKSGFFDVIREVEIEEEGEAGEIVDGAADGAFEEEGAADPFAED